MRKITIAFFFSLMYTGCSMVEDDRMCIDFGSRTIVKNQCIPVYGNLICADEEVTETYCKLYAEDDDYAILLNESRLFRS